MKRWNVNYGKKLKQWNDKAFNAVKEIEAMKRLIWILDQKIDKQDICCKNAYWIRRKLVNAEFW